MTFIPMLQQTKNLLRLYAYMCGKGEVPTEYHIWSCLSLMAACIEDRIWLEKLKDERLFPMLYVFLVGPPALGKGVAITRAFKLFNECQAGGCYWHGKTTAANLIDVLGKAGEDPETGQYFIPAPKLWLITDELTTDVGRGPQADDFIKLMTKLYTSGDVPVDTGTRTRGTVRIINPAVNWLAGTTEDWMMQCLSKDAIGSGFTSRVCYVFGRYSKERFVRPIYPPDYQEVKAHVLIRLWLLKHISGKFWMTPEAQARENAWYMNRPQPRDADLLPNWHREQDLVLKLAMLCVLADGGDRLVIEEQHVDRAIRLSQSVQRYLPQVVALANKTPEAEGHIKVEGMIKDVREWTRHQVLAQRARNRGVSTKIFTDIVKGLIAEGELEWKKMRGGTMWYRYVGGEGTS